MRFVTNLAVTLAVILLIVSPRNLQAQQLPNAPRVTCQAKDIFEARVFAAIRELNNKIVTRYSSDRGSRGMTLGGSLASWGRWGRCGDDWGNTMTRRIRRCG